MTSDTDREEASGAALQVLAKDYYARAAAWVLTVPYEEAVAALREELPPFWLDQYQAMTGHQASVFLLDYRPFTCMFDHYEPEKGRARGTVPDDEPRAVAFFGCTAPQEAPRDDFRLRGWVGPTGKTFGTHRDKGHFIAHSLGGAVLGREANVYVQRRDLNRGWSVEGRRYRAMERYGAAHPGTFCFSRPLYADRTAVPAFLEFGLLTAERCLWVECFDNRGAGSDTISSIKR